MTLRRLWIEIVQTALRGFPFPAKTGLIEIGHPDRKSPVFLTCNFQLTVERVKDALKGMDAYLLVANSRGINVWCAATGGHFTNHDVISVIKTSGIEDKVDRKKLVLPQLAATGIETSVIKEKTGWHAVWGPVYAKDIPAFVEQKYHKTTEQSQVSFPLLQRLEMAVMWAFPFTVIAALLFGFIWPHVVWPLTGLLWGLALTIFITFPLYERWLNPKREGSAISPYTIIFDLARIPFLFWCLFMIMLTWVFWTTGQFSMGPIFKWGATSFAVVLMISIDLMGSTPTYKSGLHDDRFLKIELDKERCKGAGFCEQVCPRNCYTVDHHAKTADMPRSDLCVQCGACIVQCPFDALQFISPQGDTIVPETVRKYKLNLMGKRMVKA